MPQKRNRPPPEVMTWGKAMPVLVVCVIFDALRLMFEMFWFFGPALAAVICTVKAGGSAIAGGICTLAAGTVGFFGAGAIEVFGVVMAMAVGLFGWLIVLLMNILNNANIFKENFAMLLRYGVALLISETPIVGSLPALTVVNTIMFRVQIQKGKEALKKYEEENVTQLKERSRQVAERAQFMQNQYAQQEAANDAVYDQIEAANDEKYNDKEIPEDLQKAA